VLHLNVQFACAVNTLRLSYRNQLIKLVEGNDRCFFWNRHKTPKCTVCTEGTIC